MSLYGSCNKILKQHELAEHLRQLPAVTGFLQGMHALDDCHIEVCPPDDNAINYYIYKGWYSAIVLAVLDHYYKFIYTNVGSPGRNPDGAVFYCSTLPTLLSVICLQKRQKLWKRSL